MADPSTVVRELTAENARLRATLTEIQHTEAELAGSVGYEFAAHECPSIAEAALKRPVVGRCAWCEKRRKLELFDEGGLTYSCAACVRHFLEKRAKAEVSA